MTAPPGPDDATMNGALERDLTGHRLRPDAAAQLPRAA